MGISPEEKFNREIWRILQKIKEEALFSNEQEIVWKKQDYDPDRKFFEYERGEKTILEMLEKEGAIKIREGYLVLAKMPSLEIDFSNLDYVRRLEQSGGITTLTLNIKIQQPKFDELYSQFEPIEVEFSKGYKNYAENTDDKIKNWELKKAVVDHFFPTSDFNKVAAEKPLERRSKELKEQKAANTSEVKPKKEKVLSITFIKPREPGDPHHFFVNDNLSVPIQRIRKSKWWSKIIELVESEGNVKYDEGIISYFNYNEACCIYSNRRYEPTKIFYKRNDGFLAINPSVNIKSISWKSYQNLKSKET